MGVEIKSDRHNPRRGKRKVCRGVTGGREGTWTKKAEPMIRRALPQRLDLEDLKRRKWGHPCQDKGLMAWIEARRKAFWESSGISLRNPGRDDRT